MVADGQDANVTECYECERVIGDPDEPIEDVEARCNQEAGGATYCEEDEVCVTTLTCADDLINSGEGPVIFKIKKKCLPRWGGPDENIDRCDPKRNLQGNLMYGCISKKPNGNLVTTKCCGYRNGAFPCDPATSGAELVTEFSGADKTYLKGNKQLV